MGSLKITRPERTVDLCTDAALYAEWEEAEAELTTPSRGVVDDRMIGDKPEAAVKVRDLEERMRDSTVKFRLRAMRRSEWADRVAANPPREGVADDKSRGYNTETFFDDVIIRSIVDVTQAGEKIDFDPESEWESLADEMTDRQYSDFADAIFILNRGEASVPFSPRASRMLRGSSGS